MNGRALVLVAILVCCGCAGDGDTPPASAESAPGSSQAAPSVRPVEDVLVAQLTLPGDPDWLVSDDHGLWVFRQSGEFTLVDPATNEVAGTVTIGNTNLCSGIGASFGSVWTCKGGDVVRIDPDAMAVTERFRVRKLAQQGHLPGGFGHVWVLTGDGSTLVGIDPETSRTAVEYDLPARASDVVMSDDALWLACRIDDRVLKLDPATGDVLLDLEIANPVTVATGDGEVWVGTATDTQRLDPDTGKVLVTADAPAEPEGALALDEDTVWVRNAEDFLIEVDRATGERIGQITAEDLTSSGDMLVLDGDLWVAAYDDQLLFRIDPDK